MALQAFGAQKPASLSRDRAIVESLHDWRHGVQCGVRSLHALHQVGPRGFALALQVTHRVLELLEPALDGGAGQRRLRLAGFQRRALRLEGERVGF